MASTPSERRRRAACAVLEPVLSEDALIEALRHQHDHMRGDAVSDIIRFIDQVAERNLLDAAARKRLYDAYFKAMQRPEDELPMDPWPMMQTASPSPAPPPRPNVDAASWPAVPEPRVPTVSPPVRAAIATPPAVPPTLPPPAQVFGMLWSTVLLTVHALHQRDFGDLCTAVKDELKAPPLRADLANAMAAGWEGTPLQHAWGVQASEAELADLVHRLYLALCETLGPVSADQVLTQAVRAVENKPEAAGYSPPATAVTSGGTLPH